MGQMYYLAEDGETPIPLDLADPQVQEAARTQNRTVRRSEVRGIGEVSTVFLMVNHAFGGGPPILWETMAFRSKYDDDELQERYTTCREARDNHAHMVLAMVNTSKSQMQLPRYTGLWEGLYHDAVYALDVVENTMYGVPLCGNWQDDPFGKMQPKPSRESPRTNCLPCLIRRVSESFSR